MIPKGNQRAGGQQLATHLLNAYDNDRVEVAEVRGAIAQDLHGAFAEWGAEAKATNCSKYLYSLSINPDHRQGPFTREHYYDFIRRTEGSLGLAEQPRAVVFHVKYGREHCHVVWSRIDIDKMKAVQLSHDRQKLRAVAQEYARDYKLTLPPGMQNNRGKDRFPDHAKTENLAEKQQEERSGTSKKQRMDEITKAWRESSNGRSFVKALEAGGYLLARGDRRSYVVVDLFGEVHSLSRQLDGVKSKELKARLADYSLDRLPAAAAAQDYARNRRQELLLQGQQQDRARQETSRAERAAEMKATAQQRRDALQKAQDLRRSELDAKRQKLAERHSAERKALADLQSARSADIARDRAAKQPKGVLAFLGRITGYNALTAFRHSRQDKKTDQEHRQQMGALARRHAREMESFKHQESGLTSLEKRERRSLETRLRRDVFRKIAAPAKLAPAKELTPVQQAKTEKARELAEAFRKSAAAPPRRAKDGLTPEQQAKLAEFRKSAQDISTPAAKQRRGRETARPPKSDERAQADSERATAPENLIEKFSEAARGKQAAEKVEARKPEKTADKKQPAQSRETPPADTAGDPRLRAIKENAADMTAAQRRALDLTKAFKERAGQTRREKERDQEGLKEHYRKPPPDFSYRR